MFVSLALNAHAKHSKQCFWQLRSIPRQLVNYLWLFFFFLTEGKRTMKAYFMFKAACSWLSQLCLNVSFIVCHSLVDQSVVLGSSFSSHLYKNELSAKNSYVLLSVQMSIVRETVSKYSVDLLYWVWLDRIWHPQLTRKVLKLWFSTKKCMQNMQEIMASFITASIGAFCLGLVKLWSSTFVLSQDSMLLHPSELPQFWILWTHR